MITLTAGRTVHEVSRRWWRGTYCDAVFDDLCRQILAHPQHPVFLIVCHIEPAPVSISDLLRNAGLVGGAGDLKDIDPEGAVAVLTYVLSADLAYRVARSTDGSAASLASRWVSGFGPGAEFKTNVDPEWWKDFTVGMRSSYSWDPMTTHTFDMGVVALGRTDAGVLWLADED